MKGGENMQIGNMVTMMRAPTKLSLADDLVSKSGVDNMFQSLLHESGDESLGEELVAEDISKEALIALIMQQLDEGKSLEKVFENILDDYPNIEEDYPEIIALLNTDKQSLEELKATLKELITTSKNDTEEVIGQNISSIQVVVNEIEIKDIKQEMHSILQTVSELLEKYKKDGTLNKTDSAKLTAMLKQWSSLLSQAKGTEINVEKMQEQMLDKNENDLWKKLVDRFEKRTYYTGKNFYRQDANVSKQDVRNWLQQAVDNQKQSLSDTNFSISHERQTSISKIEQYVIHLENSGKVERVGATLVDKFADVIRNSQFLNRSGKMELNLLLKPAHLGHVTIKMTQVDGEMMVKMLVSSQAAKDMLEQNMHQLRHLFQPHQISVERNEEVSDEEFYFDEQEEQQDDENQQTTEDDYQDDHNQNEDTQVLDFEAIMEQLGEEVTL